MAEGNGIDLGSIYGLLVEVAKTVSRHDALLAHQGAQLKAMAANMATKTDLAELAANMATKADLTDLRQTVTAYHSSVLGTAS